MQKKVISVLLVVLMIFATAPVSVFAEDDIFDDLDYGIDETNCEIIIYGYYDWDSYYQDVVIPSEIEGFPVARIDEYAFLECTFSSITLPNTVYRVDDYAFLDCYSFVKIIFLNEDCDISNSAAIPDDATIYAKSGGAVEDYCLEHDLTFYELPDDNDDNKEPHPDDNDDNKDPSDGVITGSCGETTWCLDEDGTFTVSGNGLMRDYLGTYYVPWYTYRDKIKQVIISEGVTSIAAYAFSDCFNLIEIVLPENVNYIGFNAFNNCKYVEKLYWNCVDVQLGLPDADNTYCSFSNLGSETAGVEVVFGESVEKIPDFAFCRMYDYMFNRHAESANNNITKVSIGKNTKVIGENAFFGCIALTSIDIPDSIETICDGAFSECTGFTNIVIPDSVKTISCGAFSGCVGLTDITIPDSVTSIGNRAFSGCKKLKNIIIPGNAILGGDVFLNCEALESVVFSNGITEIGENFGNCYSLKNISIPESVTYVSTGAFNNCGLEKIVINNPKCVIEYSASTIPVDAVIYGYANSPAQMYAQMYGRDFVALAAAACTHSYGEWIIDADATCTQRGFAHRVCALCNGYEFDVIDETGHIDEDADNICDVCDTYVSVQLPDTDDGGESDDNGLSGGISSFLQSIKELFNSIISWLRTLFGIA